MKEFAISITSRLTLNGDLLVRECLLYSIVHHST